MDALGFVEVIGFVPALEAADAMSKAGMVNVLGKRAIGGGMVTVIVKGDVASVKAAVDAGVAAVREGQLVAAHVLARPHPGVGKLINMNLV